MTHRSKFDRCIDPSFRLTRRLLGALAACALCIGFPFAAAGSRDSNAQPAFDASSLDATLADPLAIDAPEGTPRIANWDFDPAFAAHGWGIDRFSDSSSKNYYGRKLARLDNGDIVIAGLVPRSGSSVSDQLGLVRYTAAGRRIAWTSVDPAWARFGNQYIVYPNGASGQPSGAFISVVGLQEYEGNLFVMANEQSADGAVHPIVMVFAQSGFFKGWWFQVPGGSNQKPGTGFTISSSKLIVLGADPDPSDSGRPQMWMSRYSIADNGALSIDQDFGSQGIATYRAFACTVVASPTSCDTYPAAISPTGGLVQLVSPKFYVIASVKGPGRVDFATATMRFNGNGSRDTTFNYNTSSGYDGSFDFDDGGDNADVAVAIRTTSHLVVPAQVVEDVYVVSRVSRSLQAGIGVIRMDGSGALVTGFGDGGKVLFGGCGDGGAAGGNCQFSNVEDIPLSMTLSNGYLGIAGWYQGFDGTVPRFTYPMFAAVNAGNGAVDNINPYTIGIGDAVFYDVVGNGDGTFTMAGDGREFANGNNLAYLTARLQPHEFIFRNGVD
jgi:hypothetical protein